MVESHLPGEIKISRDVGWVFARLLDGRMMERCLVHQSCTWFSIVLTPGVWHRLRVDGAIAVKLRSFFQQ
jgi:hypothetical protein